MVIYTIQPVNLEILQFTSEFFKIIFTLIVYTKENGKAMATFRHHDKLLLIQTLVSLLDRDTKAGKKSERTFLRNLLNFLLMGEH